MKDTTVILIVLFTLGIGFFSCSSDDDSVEPEVEISSTPRLTRITFDPSQEVEDEYDKVVGNFSYDENNRLTSVEVIKTSVEVINTMKDTIFVRDKVDFVYSGDLLVSIIRTELLNNKVTYRNRKDLLYENNVLTQVNDSSTTTYREEDCDTIIYKSTTSFERDNGRIKGAIEKGSSMCLMNNSEIPSTITYDYEYDERGNLIKYLENSQRGGFEKFTFVYDDKQNPFPESYNFLFFDYYFESQNNNIVEETHSYFDNDAIIVEKDMYTYDYNDQGYPISASLTIEEDAESKKGIITFEYETTNQ